MSGSDTIYVATWTLLGAALAADTRLERRMAVMSAANDRTVAAGYSTPSDDSILLSCLALALTKGNKGRG